jgi:hypothetical protein
LSKYRKILREYVGAIAKSEEAIYEDARNYLCSRTEYLINVVKKCLKGDYSDLRTGEKELVWRPDVGMEL